MLQKPIQPIQQELASDDEAMDSDYDDLDHVLEEFVSFDFCIF